LHAWSTADFADGIRIGLDADHVPLRGIGEAVGVSFQRIHQLLNACPARETVRLADEGARRHTIGCSWVESSMKPTTMSLA